MTVYYKSPFLLLVGRQALVPRHSTAHVYVQTLTMSFPTPLITGTIAFIVLAVVCIGGVFAGLASGTVSKDNAA